MNNEINNENKKLNVPDSTDKGTEILNVPTLRFPEFEGEWEKCKLSTVCTFFSGGTPISSNKDYYGGEIPFIRSGEIHSSETEIFITQKGYENSSAKMVEQGDLLLAMYGATSGDIAISKIKGAINQAILCVRTAQNKKFIESVWKKHVSEILRKYLQGGQGNLSADIVKNISVFLPSQKEQTKLSNLQLLLDERIATQNELIDRLQSLIKGISEELLHNKTWSKVYLKDIFAFYSTNSLSWEKLSDENESGFRNLHYGMIHNSKSPFLDIKNMPFIKRDCIPLKYELCQNGDIAFADASEDTAEIAKAVEFREMSNEHIVCGLHTIHGRDIHNMTVAGFKGYALNTNYFHLQIKRIAQGTKVFSITASNVSACYVLLPNKDEQTKIVRILDALNSKIQVETELLNFYVKQKQHLLRQMFI